MGSLSLTESTGVLINNQESNNNIKNDAVDETTSVSVIAPVESQTELVSQQQLYSEDEDDEDEEQDYESLQAKDCKRRFDINRITTSTSFSVNDLESDGEQPMIKGNGFAFNKSDISDENSLNSQSSDESTNKLDALSRQQQNFAEPEQLRKLFIGGLDYKTSEESLKQHFDKFGDVIDCVVMRDPQTKRSRGFGFVTYANCEAVDKAQLARPHEIDGREVQSKRAISREDSGNVQPNVKKVYLGGLSDDIQESELREYFESFGNIVNVNIVAHKDTGKRRGFAFVEYDDHDPVDKIVIIKFHTVKDKRIEAKKAIPKVEMDARKRNDPRAIMAGPVLAFPGPLNTVGVAGGRPGRSGRNNGLWDGPYNSTNYPPGYSSGQSNMNGYPAHYHSPPNQYGSSSWMLHGNIGSPYGGFRGSPPNTVGYARNNYSNLPNTWAGSGEDYPDYHPTPQASSGGVGPMRLSYPHRSWTPYGTHGPYRGRGYNP